MRTTPVRRGAERGPGADRTTQIADLQAQQAQPQYAPPPPQYAPPPAAAPAPTAGSDDMVAQLTNLKSLLDQGILTQAEFDMQKQKLLAGA